MKRPLDKQERILTLKGEAAIKDRLKRIKESIKFNEQTIEFQKVQDEYQDVVRPYLRVKAKEESDKIMGTLDQNVAMEQDKLNNLQDQLKHGVETKKEVNK